MNILDLIKKKKDPSSAPAELRNGELEKETTKPNERNFVEGLVSTKDIIAPGALEVETDFIKIGNKYYRTMFTVINRRFVETNWLSSLINFDASQTVSMYIYPSDGKEILDDLRRKITEMEAEITTDIQRGRIVNPATQAKLEDALNLQADLVKGEERFFQMGLYMTLSADTKDNLDRITKNLESAMGALMVLTKRTNYQAEDGFITTLPLCLDRLNMIRNMDTTSLATTFPFVSSDLSDDKGVMYGINEHNGSLIIFDRFSMQNYNSVVFATAGAGKSYMIKLEVLRSLMMGTEIIVIDPENEYKDLGEAVGGQYIAFGYGEASKINPFDLSLVVDEGENALNSKVLTLHKLFKIMLGEMDPIEESILDRAIVEAYKMKGITPDPETQQREPPLIEDLYKSLIGMEDQKAAGIAARLEKYIKGSFAGIFNQKTTVNLNNQFVVFGIRNLEETLRPVAMHIILDYIWTVVKKELKRRILVVDEAWYLMQYDDSASFLRGIVKRGRKYYLGVTTITQDVDDFLQTPYGKEIVTNSAIQILLKQHSAAIDQVGEVFYLSEGEKQLLLAADKGEGIFFAGQNHVAIRVVASEDEHKLITSNPEEIMRMKQQKLKVEIPKPPVATRPVAEVSKEIPLTEIKPETSNKQLFETAVVTEGTEPVEEPVNKPEEVLQKRITEMEATEKAKIEEHQKAVQTEEEQKKKETETLGGAGGLPKYKDLFINKETKLPPLPPLPKFELTPTPINTPKFSTEVVQNDQTTKPLFVNQVKEVNIPQPPQLSKKPMPVFENTNPSPPAVASPLDKGDLKPKDDKSKMDYDKLFGNGIV
jgi:conjugal transfer ATP-binding protein TraC